MADINSILVGSICLTDIPREQIKEVLCKDGKKRCYLNIAVIKKKTPQTFGERTYTHFISCAPKKEERKDGINYIIADLEIKTFNPVNAPSTESIANAPGLAPDSTPDLPF